MTVGMDSHFRSQISWLVSPRAMSARISRSRWVRPATCWEASAARSASTESSEAWRPAPSLALTPLTWPVRAAVSSRRVGAGEMTELPSWVGCL